MEKMKQIIIKSLREYPSILDFYKKKNYLIVDINLAELKEKKELLNFISNKLKFPSFSGENLDAFRDWLLDLSWLKEIKVVILIKNLEGLVSLPLFKILFELLEEAHDYHKEN